MFDRENTRRLLAEICRVERILRVLDGASREEIVIYGE